jgi:hypothetical protein
VLGEEGVERRPTRPIDHPTGHNVAALTGACEGGGVCVGGGQPRELELSPKTILREINAHLDTTTVPHFTAPLGVRRHLPLFVFLPGLDGTVRQKPPQQQSGAVSASPS